MTTSTTTPDTAQQATNAPEITIDIDPATLAAAQAAANDAVSQRTTEGTTDGKKTTTGEKKPKAAPLPPVRAIPALVVSTGSTTTAAALVAGASLTPAGLGAIAAGTFCAGVATIVATRDKPKAGGAKTKSGGAKKNAEKTAARHGAAGRTGARPGGTTGPRKSGGAAKSGGKSGGKGGLLSRTRNAGAGAGGGKGKGGGGAAGKNGGGKGKHASPAAKSGGIGPARTPAAKKVKDALTAPSSKTPKSTKDSKNATGGGTGKTNTGGGKAGTRAALKKAKDRAANSVPGRVARAGGRGVKAVAKPLGTAAKKVAKVSGLAAVGRAAHKVTTRPAGRGIKKAWQSKAAHTARAALGRLARKGTQRLVTGPLLRGLKIVSAWRKALRTTHRGKTAHAARVTLGGIGALTIGALAAGPGIIAGTVAGVFRHRQWKTILVWGKTVTLRVFVHCVKRSRAQLAHAQRLNNVVFSVTDPGNPATPPPAAGAAPGDVLAMLLGGTSMSRLLLATQNLADAYTRYSPPRMDAMGAEYAGLPNGIRSAASALQHLARNSNDRYPVDPRLSEAVVAIYQSLMKAAGFADGIYPNFRVVHEHDIRRMEEPRKGFSGEAMWNIRPTVQGDMMGFNRPSVFAQGCLDIATAYAAFAPESMIQVYREYSALGDSLRHVAAAVGHLAKNSNDNYPVHESVAEQLNDLFAQLRDTASMGDDLMSLFRRLHPLDLAKHENPRKGPGVEMAWDV